MLTAAQRSVSAPPARMIRCTPKRWISRPVTKPGRNIAIECARITSALAPTPKPHSSICNGVEAITRFIVP